MPCPSLEPLATVLNTVIPDDNFLCNTCYAQGHRWVEPYGEHTRHSYAHALVKCSPKDTIAQDIFTSLQSAKSKPCEMHLQAEQLSHRLDNVEAGMMRLERMLGSILVKLDKTT